jgi:hypothetical protein
MAAGPTGAGSGRARLAALTVALAASAGRQFGASAIDGLMIGARGSRGAGHCCTPRSGRPALTRGRRPSMACFPQQPHTTPPAGCLVTSDGRAGLAVAATSVAKLRMLEAVYRSRLTSLLQDTIKTKRRGGVLGGLCVERTWMSAAASRPRVSAGGLRGTAARLCERPACCAGLDRRAGRPSRGAIPTQGDAPTRSHSSHTLPLVVAPWLPLPLPLPRSTDPPHKRLPDGR